MTDLERLQAYDEELSKVMPKDYKDWWENSKDEWPLIARLMIEDLREERELCYETIGIMSKKIEELEKKVEELEDDKQQLIWELAGEDL